MFQGTVRVLLGFKPHKAELAELAVLGELERAVCHGAEGSKHGPEPLLLHLHTGHTLTFTGGLRQNAAAVTVCGHPGGLLTPLGRFLTMSLDIFIVAVNIIALI